MAMVVTEAAMVAAESSEIKNKAKLREYLYKNPAKLAQKLAKFLQDEQGNLLEPVKIKGKGMGYYYSHNDKKFIPTPRDGEYYLLPWTAEDPSDCYIYSHYCWMIGVILKVKKEEIKFIGFN
jgi:hypothetical protein